MKRVSKPLAPATQPARRMASAAVTALLLASSAPPSAVAANAPLAPAPDYAIAANWICRPGAEDACTNGLDATLLGPNGEKRPLPFEPAKTPAVDCFYVYPTVSKEQTAYADLADSPEIQSAANHQIGRLASRCRVFAPIYRQETIAGLTRRLQGDTSAVSDAPLRDVEAAWAYYLAHDNHGRGVVLVGHSQGTILLQQLIAHDIDGTAQQRLLVSAFLAGDPSLAVPAGKKVGGTFAHVPVCSAAAETGCVYVWGSYRKDDPSLSRIFGGPLENGMVSACESPAAPAGGMGDLKFFHSASPELTPVNTPWIEFTGALSGMCRSDAAGNSFMVATEPGPGAAALETVFEHSQIAPGWGLHLLDIGLVQGNMLDVLDAEIATWTSGRR